MSCYLHREVDAPKSENHLTGQSLRYVEAFNCSSWMGYGEFLNTLKLKCVCVYTYVPFNGEEGYSF